MTPLPITPALLAEAETLAREWIDACGTAGPLIARPVARVRAKLIAHCMPAHAALLADISRPAARDHWVRWIAKRRKIKVWAVHQIICGIISGPPEWGADLNAEILGATTEAEALRLALHYLMSDGYALLDGAPIRIDTPDNTQAPAEPGGDDRE